MGAQADTVSMLKPVNRERNCGDGAELNHRDKRIAAAGYHT
jgi:hypothetical protein